MHEREEVPLTENAPLSGLQIEEVKLDLILLVEDIVPDYFSLCVFLLIFGSSVLLHKHKNFVLDAVHCSFVVIRLYFSDDLEVSIATEPHCHLLLALVKLLF